MSTTTKINASRFFYEWKGHPLSDVTALHAKVLSLRPDKPIIYLAGDSSLDNKYWVSSIRRDERDVPEIYDAAFDKRSSSLKPDVAFWLNHLLGNQATTLNLAVEESMLRERDRELL